MAAVSSSTRLEHLDLHSIGSRERNGNHEQEVLDAVPSFKMKNLKLIFAHDNGQAALLELLKRNYFIQNVECAVLPGREYWNEANRMRLDFYLNRNRKLSQWMENPKLVPRDLWPEAMKLALEAGITSLYLSLLELSSEGIGLS